MKTTRIQRIQSCNPKRLARAFCREVQASLSLWHLARVNSRNARESNPSICHLHDFTDGNQIMLNAFESLRLPNPASADMMNNYACLALWEKAWSLAKQNKFNPETI